MSRISFFLRIFKDSHYHNLGYVGKIRPCVFWKCYLQIVKDLNSETYNLTEFKKKGLLVCLKIFINHIFLMTLKKNPSLLLFQDFSKNQTFWKVLDIGHWTLGSGGKKTVKRSEKHRYQKIMLSKAKSAQKLPFFPRWFYTIYY